MPPPQTGREEYIDSTYLTPCHNNQRLLRNRLRRKRWFFCKDLSRALHLSLFWWLSTPFTAQSPWRLSPRVLGPRLQSRFADQVSAKRISQPNTLMASARNQDWMYNNLLDFLNFNVTKETVRAASLPTCPDLAALHKILWRARGPEEPGEV